MKAFLILSAMLAVLLPDFAQSAEPVQVVKLRDMEPGENSAYGPQLLGQQVPHLPNDSQVLYVAVIFNSDYPNDAADIELQQWFNTVPELIDLKNRGRYREYRPSDKYFTTIAAKHFSQRPAVIIQESNGDTVYRCYTRELEGDPRKLVDEISKSLHKRFPNMPYLFPVLRPCPDPNTPPPVVPAPYPMPVGPVPQIRPIDAPKPAAKDDSAMAAGIIGALAALTVFFGAPVALGIGWLISSKRESVFPS